MMSNSIILVQV